MYCCIVIPVLIYFALFFTYTVNAPINDDYSVLDFLNKCISTDSFTEKLKLIFAQHNEHRIAFTRLFTVLSYKLQQNVDFNVLAFLGNLALVGIALIFLKHFPKNKVLWFFIPVTIILFNITLWENMTFGMAAHSNLTVFLFILLSLHWLTLSEQLKPKYIALSLLFFIAAVGTQGAGLFLLPLSALILIYRKDYKALTIYLAVSLPVVALYFYGYQQPLHTDKVFNLELVGQILQFAFAFLGNAFNFYRIYISPKPSITVTTCAGILFFILFLYSSWKQYYKKNLFVYSVMLFMIGLAFVTAYSRVSFGVETASASRYRINGVIFFIALYYWIMDTVKWDKKVYIFAVNILAIIYYALFNLNQYQYLSVRQKQTYAGILYYKSGNPGLLNCDRLDMAYYTGIIENSRDLDTYHFPDDKELAEYFPYSERQIVGTTTSVKTTIYPTVDSISETVDSYIIEGWAFLENEPTSSQTVYVGLKNAADSEPVYYLAKSTERFDLNGYFKKSYLKNGGFMARIKKEYLQQGETKIWIMVKTPNSMNMQVTDKIISK
jgi:hypothetical protein